jgi:hypothetical protein
MLNPYEPRDIRTDTRSDLDRASNEPPTQLLVSLAIKCGFLGCLGFGMLSFWGSMVLAGLLDTLCCPPLRPMGNFGQFGFVAILYGLFGCIVGASIALLPFEGIALWVAHYAIACLVFHWLMLEPNAPLFPLSVMHTAEWILFVLMLGLVYFIHRNVTQSISDALAASRDESNLTTPASNENGT